MIINYCGTALVIWIVGDVGGHTDAIFRPQGRKTLANVKLFSVRH